jgi:hypothetical protein
MDAPFIIFLLWYVIGLYLCYTISDQVPGIIEKHWDRYPILKILSIHTLTRLVGVAFALFILTWPILLLVGLLKDTRSG